MADIDHQWGSDLSIGPTGDIAIASDALVVQERVLRRLLTNPLGYLWQPSYGAGLASFVGQPANATQIQALIRSQIFRETAVAQTPAPTIAVNLDPSGGASVSVLITYADATTGQTQTLSIPVGS